LERVEGGEQRYSDGTEIKEAKGCLLGWSGIKRENSRTIFAADGDDAQSVN
jgi:hypothetical protein